MLTLLLGALFRLLCEFGIKSVCGGLHNPQSQGLVEQGNRTVKQKLLAWQNDHDASPAWSLLLLSISLSINSSLSYSTPKTLFEVFFHHPVISRSWSHPRKSDDEVEDNDTPDAHLPPNTDVAHVKWSLDQSDIQQQDEDLGKIIASEHTNVSQEVEEESSNLQVDESDEAGVYSDWEGLGDSVSGNQAGQDEDSRSSEASLPNTASLFGGPPHDG